MKKRFLFAVLVSINTVLASIGSTWITGCEFLENRIYAAQADERMTYLELRYSDIPVVDGHYDNDIIFDAVCMAIENHDDRLLIYRDTGDIFTSFTKFKAASDFQYFWLDSVSISSYEDFSIITFHYLYNEYETERMLEQIDRIHRDIQYDLMYYAGDDEWKVAEYVYNYLAREVTFSNCEGTNIRNIYGAIVEGNAVCSGYAAAFDYIMSRLGYNVGVAGNSHHMWNYVMWNSDDCFIDVTWGDPDTYDMYSNHFIDFSYMGMTYDELLTLDSHELEYVYISGRGFNGCDVGFSDYRGDTDKNYCDIMGFNAGYFSYDIVEAIFRIQYDLNECSMIVKFSNTSEWNSAVYILTANDYEVLNSILTDLGYFGRYHFIDNEACNTIVLDIGVA